VKEGDGTKEEKGIRDACRNLWVPKSSSGDLREGNEGSLSRQLGRCVDNFWTLVALKRVAFGDRGKGEGEKIRNSWEREGSGTRCRHHHLKPSIEAFDAFNLDVRVWHMEGRRSVPIQLGVKDRDRSKVQFHRVSSSYIAI